MLNRIDKVKEIDLQIIKSIDANINVFEKLDELFTIKRIFTVEINQFNKNERGRHAHKIDHQIVTCPSGSINFLVTDGISKKEFAINSRNKAVYVPNHIWTETSYLEKNTIVTCYCSENYNEKSYIRNYNDFISFRKLFK